MALSHIMALKDCKKVPSRAFRLPHIAVSASACLRFVSVACSCHHSHAQRIPGHRQCCQSAPMIMMPTIANVNTMAIVRCVRRPPNTWSWKSTATRSVA